MKILIDTDWFASIQDLTPSKQKEVLEAILNYPDKDSDTNLWKKTIKPNLEKGAIKYFNKLQNLKQNNPQKTGKKNTDSVSESDTDSTRREYIYKEISNIGDSNKDSNKGGMGEKEKGKEKGEFVPPTLEEVLEYAGEQNNFAGCGGFVCTQEQAEEFWSYYESQGWRIGNDSNTPIRDWKPKLRQWCIKAKQTPTNQFGQRVVKMTAKEIKEAENHIKLQKMLNGEL